MTGLIAAIRVNYLSISGGSADRQQDDSDMPLMDAKVRALKSKVRSRPGMP